MSHLTIAPDERLTRRPEITEPGPKQQERGPTRPDIGKPDGGNELLKRMKKIDPDRAKKYRQRSGE